MSKECRKYSCIYCVFSFKLTEGDGSGLLRPKEEPEEDREDQPGPSPAPQPGPSEEPTPGPSGEPQVCRHMVAKMSKGHFGLPVLKLLHSALDASED